MPIKGLWNRVIYISFASLTVAGKLIIYGNWSLCNKSGGGSCIRFAHSLSILTIYRWHNVRAMPATVTAVFNCIHQSRIGLQIRAPLLLIHCTSIFSIIHEFSWESDSHFIYVTTKIDRIANWLTKRGKKMRHSEQQRRVLNGVALKRYA